MKIESFSSAALGSPDKTRDLNLCTSYTRTRTYVMSDLYSLRVISYCSRRTALLARFQVFFFVKIRTAIILFFDLMLSTFSVTLRTRECSKTNTSLRPCIERYRYKLIVAIQACERGRIFRSLWRGGVL